MHILNDSVFLCINTQEKNPMWPSLGKSLRQHSNQPYWLKPIRTDAQWLCKWKCILPQILDIKLSLIHTHFRLALHVSVIQPSRIIIKNNLPSLPKKKLAAPSSAPSNDAPVLPFVGKVLVREPRVPDQQSATGDQDLGSSALGKHNNPRWEVVHMQCFFVDLFVRISFY